MKAENAKSWQVLKAPETDSSCMDQVEGQKDPWTGARGIPKQDSRVAPLRYMVFAELSAKFSQGRASF